MFSMYVYAFYVCLCGWRHEDAMDANSGARERERERDRMRVKDD